MQQEKDEIKGLSISLPSQTSKVYLVMGLLAIIFCLISVRAKALETKVVNKGVSKMTAAKSTEAGTPANNAPNNSSNIAHIKSKEHTDVLYKLLVSQIATSRQNKTQALQSATDAAEITQDPAIATYATELAIQFQDPEAAIKNAEIWAKNAGSDLQAQMVAATLLISFSIDRAIPYLTQAMIIDPNQVNQHLISIQSRLSDRSAENLKIALEQIAKKRDKDPYAQLLAAQSTAQQGEISRANTLADQALQLKPDLTQGIELKARLIRYEDKSDAKALQYLAQKVQQFPKDAELRMFLASALMDAKQYNESVAHLTKLTEDNVWGGQAKLFLGEIYLTDSKLQKAKDYLLSAANYKEVADNAKYDLGILAELQNNSKDAIQWYSAVNAGPFSATATLRAVALLKKDQKYKESLRLLRDANPITFEDQKLLLLTELDILMASNQMEDANALVDTLVEKVPEDVDFLFAHSAIAVKQQRWKIAENDLKTILTLNPDSASAMNSLGYILSFQKDRLPEARSFLNKALAIEPKNPVYLDTLGWIEYKMGDYKNAIAHLKQAHGLSNGPGKNSLNPSNKSNNNAKISANSTTGNNADPISLSEVAAHLGEVLWVTGEKEEAMNVWLNAYKLNPDNQVLLETFDRLKVNNPNLKSKASKITPQSEQSKSEPSMIEPVKSSKQSAKTTQRKGNGM